MVVKKKKMKDEEYENETDIDEPAEENSKDFADDYDIIESLERVYNRRASDLDENFVLMKGEDAKLNEFIARQHMTAKKIYNLLPDKRWARMIYELIMLELKDRAIMNRNRKGNLIVEGIISRGMNGNIGDKIKDEPKEGILGKAKSTLKRIVGQERKTGDEGQAILN